MFLQHSPHNLSEIEPSVQALLYHLRQETDPQLTQRKSYYNYELNAYVYEMSNGAIYLLNEINQWVAIDADAY
jgi:hypothetical protein